MLSEFIKEKGFISILENLRQGVRRQNAEGLWGSSPSLFAPAVLTALRGNVVFVTGGIEAAETFHEEFGNFISKDMLRFFPPVDCAHAPGGGDFRGPRGRLRTISGIIDSPPVLIAAPVQSLLQMLLKSESVSGNSFEARADEIADIRKLLGIVSDSGYERVEEVHFPGEFALRGGIFDIFPVQDELPSRIEFDGDTIASIRRFEPEGQLSVARTGSVKILQVKSAEGVGNDTLFACLGRDTVFLLYDPPAIRRKAAEIGLFEKEMSEKAGCERLIGAEELSEHIAKYRTVNMFPFGASEEDSDCPAAEFEVADGASSTESEQRRAALALGGKGVRVFPFFDNEAGFRRMKELLGDFPELKAGITPKRGRLAAGFIMPDINLALISSMNRSCPRGPVFKGSAAADRSGIDPGDYVVHINHGVGIYRGLKAFPVDGREEEFLEIEYLEGDRLYIPPSQMRLVSKYSGVDGHEPPVSRLGGSSWKKTRDKAEKSIRDLAGELIELGALREAGRGFGFSPDSDWQRDFEDSFAYEETQGQLSAVEEIKRDMEAEKPMDRIICGDSGYGKTEVALRAAFKCLMGGKQAAMLSPTTVLAEQHFNTFSERMENFPVNTAVLSRFKSRAEQKKILEGLKNGSIDIVIGTHRLLQADVSFKDLGLVIIDEEQRFGVAQKEKLKKIRSTVDVLSMSATPIPRTLYMSLVGIRDISVIETAPGMRLPVEGRVAPFSKKLVRTAVLRELERNCQVFYLHNRVQTIEHAAGMIRELVPEARVGIAHGQMDPGELEKTMKDFLDYKTDVLVCTTIIESGLDIQRANTIIIDRADAFGLADLYQLKGRVGRWNRKGYAFFLTGRESRTPASEKRLKAIYELAGSGGGLNTAMKDLQMRGAGNLLGRQQHGHIAAVGFDLYCKLLRAAAARLKGEEIFESETVFDLGFEPCIPRDYIPGIKNRVDVYRRLSSARGRGDIEALESEMRDRFGKPPLPVAGLLKSFLLKVSAEEKGVVYAGVEGGTLKIRFRNGREIKEILEPVGDRWRALDVLEEKIGIF